MRLRQLVDEPVIDYPSNRGVAFSIPIRRTFLEHAVVPNVVEEEPDTVTLIPLADGGTVRPRPYTLSAGSNRHRPEAGRQ